MPKGIPNKRYTPEFKKLVIETMLEEKLSYSETARRFDVGDHHRIQDWERIYLTEVQRLRAENEYLKKLQALVLEEERRRHKKRR